MHPTCTICSTPFSVQFSYQVEKSDTEAGTHFSYFCSQRCLEQSHRGDGGEVCCDACGRSFRVELAAHVLFVGQNRRYACSPACRASLRGRREELRQAAATTTATVVPLPTPPRAAPAPSRQRPDAQVLAVFNHKGGTGKTTTSVTVAAGLAARGFKVLLVDVDGQGNVAMSLGLEAQRSLYHVLVMGLALNQATTQARPGLDILPSNETLAAAELYLAGRAERDRVLAERLAPAKREYDFIVLDCSPSLSLLNQNALVCADAVLCPVGCDYLSLVGVRQVLRTLKQVNKLLGHPVALWGVLPTFYDSRAKICQEALSTLREHFGPRCLDPIRVTTKIKEAPAKHLTLQEHARGSSAADDYERVVERLSATRAMTRDRSDAALAGGMG